MEGFNWVLVFEEELNKGSVTFDKQGKFAQNHRISKDNPWLGTKELAVGAKAMKGCTEYHLYFSGSMGRLGFIHSYCHDCYKVVAKPKTVKQLFQLHALQQKMGLPAKCGIEIRPFVPRLYGGYFYNRSLEAGKECLKKVKKAVRTEIDPSMQVLLKRGCTEFEMRFGDSDKWKIEPEQIKFEKEFLEVYRPDMPEEMELPLYVQSHIKTRWLHWAAQNNDMTYKEFTDGVSLIGEPKYVEYK